MLAAPTYQVTIRLSDAEYATLQAYAAKHGTTVYDVAKAAVLATLTPSELASALARLPRRRAPRTCAWCGQPFQSTHNTARYDSPRCKRQAAWARARARRKEQQP